MSEIDSAADYTDLQLEKNEVNLDDFKENEIEGSLADWQETPYRASVHQSQDWAFVGAMLPYSSSQ